MSHNKEHVSLFSSFCSAVSAGCSVLVLSLEYHTNSEASALLSLHGIGMSLAGLIGADKSFSVSSFSGGRQLIAAKSFPAGEVLGYTKGTIVNSPDMHSIQLKSDRHIDVRGSGLELASHSCEPNCRMIVRTFEEDGEDSLSLVSIIPIEIGDAITWDYETSEWELSSPCMLNIIA